MSKIATINFSALIVAFLALIPSSLAAQGVPVAGQPSGFKLSGFFSCTSKVAPVMQFTNYFHMECGADSYLIEFFDQQSNLLSQARCDGREVSCWWKAAQVSNAISTLWIDSATNQLQKEAPVRYPDEMLVRPLLWSVPALSSLLPVLFRRAQSDPDYFSNASQENPSGLDKVDVFDAEHRLLERQIVFCKTFGSGSGSVSVTNTIYLTTFTNYLQASGTWLPTRITVADRRIGIGPAFVHTYLAVIDHAEFGPLPSLPRKVIDGLPRTRIAIIDRRPGHHFSEVDNTLKDADLAPDFTATTFAGKPFQLSDFRGKYVLLDFWATWCPPCLAEMRNVKSVFDAYGGDGRFAIVGLSLDKNMAAPANYVQAQNIPWNQVLIGDVSTNAVVRDYGATSIPKLFLIGPDGRIIARELRGAAIKEAVAAALGPVALK